MTKFSGLWVLFLVIGTPFVFLYFSGSSISDMVFTHHVGGVTVKATSRKLKVNGYKNNLDTDKKMVAGDVNLEDYHPIDPVPSSKASIKPGPIQHGTPLIPYIPKPSPPGHPKPERTKKRKKAIWNLAFQKPTWVKNLRLWLTFGI